MPDTPTAAGDVPSRELRSADGAMARVLLDGAQVVSWRPAAETEDRLYLSARAECGRGVSARGGIPVCFPQFGPFGALPQHGFARTHRWSILDESRIGAGELRLGLTEGDLAPDRPERERVAWPHAFHAELAVQVGGASLTVSLSVVNPGAAPLTFTAALHPYFAVRDAFRREVTGLAGLTYRDALRQGERFTETERALAITGPLDRIYFGAPDILELREPHRALRIEKSGFPDAVVWNPGATITAAKPDFVPGDEHRMLCVEAGAIGASIALAPGEHWTGAQRMIARLTSA